MSNVRKTMRLDYKVVNGEPDDDGEIELRPRLDGDNRLASFWVKPSVLQFKSGEEIEVIIRTPEDREPDDPTERAVSLAVELFQLGVSAVDVPRVVALLVQRGLL